MKIHDHAASLAELIQANQCIFVQGQAATPNEILNAIVERARNELSHQSLNHPLRGVEFLHLHTEGPARYQDPEFQGIFKVANLFTGANLRENMNSDRIDYLPCFLSEMPALIRSKKRKIDVAIVSVSPPDPHGFCSLGTSIDATRAAVETADLVIAQINQQMPRTHGDGLVHIDQIDHAIEVDVPLPAPVPKPLTEIEIQIGKRVAGLIEDGSTLQMGIGSIPDAVLCELKNHRSLGIHTEMWTDGALDLILSGAVDNSKKIVRPGKTVSTFIIGTKRVYDFIDDNPSVVQLEASYVNRVDVIARNPKVVAINSAVELDLTGQVCADSIGSKIISGVGGQIDFIRGASVSEGGKPIIAMTARTQKGIPRFAACLKPGAGVVTTRAHVHFVATEYGVADLYGRTLGERAKLLIDLAHPDDREKLSRDWFAIRSH